MRLRTQFLTENRCYRAGRRIKPKGVMIHSTGANNPKVCRYVPGDNELGHNTGNNHWNRITTEVCVHAFIGNFGDGSVGTVQTLPWDYRASHCGGSGNNTHISFEVCEDDLTDASYFNAVYQEAVELTAFLCQVYELDPLSPGVVICHAEGYKRGVASNHGDVQHWFPRHGKTMDDFRADVARVMEVPDMTRDDLKAMVREVLAEIEAEKATLPPSSWATELLADAKKKGITDGTRPRSTATREEVAIMVRAAVDKNRH